MIRRPDRRLHSLRQAFYAPDTVPTFGHPDIVTDLTADEAPSDASHNLGLTYERAKQNEEFYKNEINGAVTKAAGALAFFGVVVAGVFTAIGNITWGLAQWKTELRIFFIAYPNILTLVAVCGLTAIAFYDLLEILQRARVRLPWGNRIEDPDALLERDGDDVMMELIAALDLSNRESETELNRLTKLLTSALTGLALSSVLLMGQAGYNSAMKTFLDEGHYAAMMRGTVTKNVLWKP